MKPLMPQDWATRWISRRFGELALALIAGCPGWKLCSPGQLQFKALHRSPAAKNYLAAGSGAWRFSRNVPMVSSRTFPFGLATVPENVPSITSPTLPSVVSIPIATIRFINQTFQSNPFRTHKSQDLSPRQSRAVNFVNLVANLHPRSVFEFVGQSARDGQQRRKLLGFAFHFAQHESQPLLSQ